jgi:hypothetical protein
MISKVEFVCASCQNSHCFISIWMDFQGGVHAFKPRVKCLISSALDNKAEWELA